MKKLIILSLILVPFFAKAQDSTIITSLNLKAGTIRLIVGSTAINEHSARPFAKWSDSFVSNPPVNDNANVAIDTIEVSLLLDFYSTLLAIPAGITEVNDFIGDFKTSIQSKRSTNSYLDNLCNTLESSFSTQFQATKQRGNKMLTGN